MVPQRTEQKKFKQYLDIRYIKLQMAIVPSDNAYINIV